ncbi:hypothetical protein KSD_38510 [Ktedonobacter sp. SOSP1-85]|uniref:hypothetical protein n=1 Tax=Ktedonobacter sp. SOSP1-85 TaxID=2778367 RepID=UPI0019156093|nr:hypothetical protein [Ktedonobacter sp. SOSP1-85]GHO76080.1 hypothetical protein KSD_38510 [Ktedonobacter sp. SOSP1-85]
MKKKLYVGVLGCLVALCALLLTTQSALAHEKRHVGKYTFVVGFLDEPAYANIKNGLDLTICNGDACTYTVTDGQKVVSNPVENAEQTLKAEVIQGGAQPLALTVEPRYANPGKYAGYFLPTTAGAYTFHIYGTLNGQQIDEKFTSSPNGFGEVEQITAYPATTKNVSTSAADTSALAQQVKDAQNSAQVASTLGIAGIVVGVVGMALAAFAFTRKSRVMQATQEPAESLRG